MEFRILGPLEVQDGDRQLALGGTRQRALLALLLLHANEVVSSDRLSAALWGEEGPGDNSKALQVAVSRLRRVLEPDPAARQDSGLLVTRPPGYELRVGKEQLDLHRFELWVTRGREALDAGEPAVAAQRLHDALALWRGPPLADLAYEPFAQTEIARLEDRRASALEDRIAADLELGRHAALTGELERLVAEHPYRERLWSALMLALYRSGRQVEALDVYREARRALVDELGIEPGRELRDLHQSILDQDVALELARSSEAATSAGFVGREREMTEMRSALEATFSGTGALVLVGGEPGVGKSRLAEELAARAGERGSRILIGRCWEAGGAPPYWPWVQVLRAYVREAEPTVLRSNVERGGGELATILPELRELLPDLPTPSRSDSEGARFRLFESVSSFLRGAATAGPLALFLDDLHAADEPSLLLLRFLSGELVDIPILIVGCYRDTEVGPDHPLAEALPELAREGSVRRVSLRGLGRADTARLLELTAGQAPSAALAARIHHETEGNPLFASQIGHLLSSEGPLDPAGLEGGLPIPEGVREAIGRRLARHSDGCRQTLTLASVLGREFDLDALERVSGLGQHELFELLEEATAARLVGEVPGAKGRLRFSHVLIRDALYEDLPPTRRLRLHREIGDALEVLYARSLESHLAELAFHYLGAGSAESDKALRYAARAGDRAASQLAFEEAARHYLSALSVLETTGSDDAKTACDLLLSLGEALSRAGNDSEAKEAFRRAAAIAEREGWSDALARAASGYGGRFVWARAGSDPVLVPLLERAIAAVGVKDSPARVRLLVRLAAATRDEPLRDRRLRVADEALDMARRIDDPVTLAYALEGYWPAVEGPDNVDSRIGAADELIRLGEEIGDKERVYVGHDYRLHTFWALGDRAGVDVALDALSSLAGDLRQPAQQWLLACQQVTLALMEGRFERAEELISEALALGREAQSWNAVVSQRLGLFVLRREQGRLAELEDVIERSVHQFPALPRFRCALAHLYAEVGREREARATFDDLLSGDLGREYLDAEWLFMMSLLPDVCVFLADEGAAARLHALLLPYERLYAEAPTEACFGSVARGLGVLATLLGRFDDAERHFDAALEVERRMNARPWLAHTQHDFAAMLLARGGTDARRRAHDLLAAARQTFDALGMETWAARARALD